MKRADNHIWTVFMHNILEDVSKSFPYFDYDKNKFVSERIKALSNTKRKDKSVTLQRVLA